MRPCGTLTGCCSMVHLHVASWMLPALPFLPSSRPSYAAPSMQRISMCHAGAPTHDAASCMRSVALRLSWEAPGQTTTGFLKDLEYTPKAIEVLAPGMNTTVQACPHLSATASWLESSLVSPTFQRSKRRFSGFAFLAESYCLP